jgi:hypothetical protein
MPSSTLVIVPVFRYMVTPEERRGAPGKTR